MTAREVANLLQMHIVTVYRLAERGQLPAFKVGKQWRFREEAIVEWAQLQERRRVRVLVVDDEADVGQAMAATLEPLGCLVTTCLTGEEAISRARDVHFQLAFLDLKMTGMNGVEVMRELARISPKTAVAIMTAYPTDKLVAEAAGLGPVTILIKPFDMSVLERIVQPLLAQEA